MVFNVITEIGQVGSWLQALGVVVLIAIIFDVISFIYNRKRLREIGQIRKDMVRIEEKIDKVIKKKR